MASRSGRPSLFLEYYQETQKESSERCLTTASDAGHLKCRMGNLQNSIRLKIDLRGASTDLML